MANIDDILANKLTEKRHIETLKKAGISELTNKSGIIQVLVNAALDGDTKAALWLLENSTSDKSKAETISPLEKARKKANEKKGKKTK